jgi:hypothetical protein
MSELKHQIQCPVCKEMVSKLVKGKKCYDCAFSEKSKTRTPKLTAHQVWGIDNSLPDDDCEVLF